MTAHKNDFRWNEYNREQVRKHGLSERAVEFVVRSARHPFPHKYGRKNGWRVVGRTPTYELIEVLYAIGEDDKIFVYHAS